MTEKKPYLLLLGLVGLVYANVYLNSFHFDDLTAILQKPWIRGLDKIPMFLFSFAQRPLVILSFNLNYYISEFQVWSYHLFNIGFHVIAVCLVYRLALELSVLLRNSDLISNRRNGFLAATLFAVHPLNTQAVTYISSRSSIMATCFYLTATIFLLKGYGGRKDFQEKRSKSSNKKLSGNIPFILSFMCLFFGVLCKEIIVTFPAVAILVHFLFFSRYSISYWVRQNFRIICGVGFCLFLILFVIIFLKLLFVPDFNRTIAYQNYSIFKKITLLFQVSKMFPTTFSWQTYLLTQTFVVPFEYFWKIFFPFNLSIDIDFPLISDWTRVSSFLGIIFLGLYLWVGFTVSSILIRFGMLWGLITLLPTSSIVPLFDIAVEHRTYLPLAGFSLAMAAIISMVSNAVGDWFREKFPKKMNYSILSLIFPIVIIMCFGILTVNRNKVWKDEISLWNDAKTKAPKIVRPYNNLGEAYDKLGNYSSAIDEFKAALSLNPNYVFALSNLGNIYGKLKNYQESVKYFQKAIAIKPDYAPANYNLGKALHALGKPRQARGYYQKAVEANSYFVEAIFNLAHIETELGFYDDAIKNYRKFIELQPKLDRAYLGLGRAFLGVKENAKAIEAFKKAVELNPSSLSPSLNLATAYLNSGNIDESINIFNRVLQRFPKIAGIHKNLGLIYYQHKQNPQKALHHFKESLKLDGNQPQANQIRATISELEGTK
jgi:protein O-mannosyl-transferase